MKCPTNMLGQIGSAVLTGFAIPGWGWTARWREWDETRNESSGRYSKSSTVSSWIVFIKSEISDEYGITFSFSARLWKAKMVLGNRGGFFCKKLWKIEEVIFLQFKAEHFSIVCKVGFSIYQCKAGYVAG